MALFYIVLSVGVMVLNFERLPYVFESIIAGAFNPAAFTGGTIGSLFVSMQKGVSRGIFSNEAGLGTGSIAHACADTKKPVKQGMFGIFEVFADTIVICTLTAMVILCSGTTVNYGTAAGAELTISGFTTTYGGWASIFTAVALCCFAFSTIIGWGLYGSRFLVFLCRSDKVAKPFFLVYSFVSILGATMDLGLLWSIADTFNGLMSIPNLLALLLLSGTVVRLTKEFFCIGGLIAHNKKRLLHFRLKRCATASFVIRAGVPVPAPHSAPSNRRPCGYFLPRERVVRLWEGFKKRLGLCR